MLEMRRIASVTNGKIGLVAYKYPPINGTGHDAKAENVVIKDMIFALANGFVSSIVLTKKTLRIENMATYLALSSIAEIIARFREPLGAIMSVTNPKKPHV